MQVEPEAALKLTNRKFRKRFEYIENALHARGQAFDQTSIDELEELWQEAKKNRKQVQSAGAGRCNSCSVLNCSCLIASH